MNGKYIGSRPVKLRKSTWKDRTYEVVKKKEKEKKKLGFKSLFLNVYRSLRNGYIKLPVVLDPAPLPPRPPPPPPPFHQPAGFNSREERYRSEDSTVASSRSGFPSGNGYTAASRMTKYYVILAYRLSEISNLTPAVLFNNG